MTKICTIRAFYKGARAVSGEIKNMQNEIQSFGILLMMMSLVVGGGFALEKEKFLYRYEFLCCKPWKITIENIFHSFHRLHHFRISYKLGHISNNELLIL